MPNGQGLKSYKLPPVMGVAVTGWIALKASPFSVGRCKQTDMKLPLLKDFGKRFSPDLSLRVVNELLVDLGRAKAEAIFIGGACYLGNVG
jgi:hypothetical protein